MPETAGTPTISEFPPFSKNCADSFEDAISSRSSHPKYLAFHINR